MPVVLTRKEVAVKKDKETDKNYALYLESVASVMTTRRKLAGLHQTKMADCAGLSVGTISNMECAVRDLSLHNFINACYATGSHPPAVLEQLLKEWAMSTVQANQSGPSTQE